MDNSEKILTDFLTTKKLDREFIAFAKEMLKIAAKEDRIDEVYEFKDKLIKNNKNFSEDDEIERGIAAAAFVLLLLSLFIEYVMNYK